MKYFKNLISFLDKNFGIIFFYKENKITSLHGLNNDRGLSISQRVLYWIFNWANNLFPYKNIDEKLEIRDFKCKNLKKKWSKLYLKSSPSRKLSDLFWINLPWSKIKEELKEINILDIGCGSGNYGQRLVNFSNNNISGYKGIDIYENENWAKLEKKYSFFRFEKFDGINITKNIPKDTNFFMTQSAIEHFDEDLDFFKQIKDYIISFKNNVIQIHLFPSKVCLYLYRYHGARQYTPRTISKVTKLFKDFSSTILYNLGGDFCNYLHYNYIINPLKKRGVDMRDTKPQEYDKLLFKSIKKDMTHSSKLPTFYALIINSNWNKKDKIF